MLSDKKEEQLVLFKDIVIRKITVREAESFARNVAQDRVRKKSLIDPALIELERKFKETLGTKVYIEKKEHGGRIMIDFFDNSDIQALLERFLQSGTVNSQASSAKISEATPLRVTDEKPIDDRAPADVVEALEESTEDLYSMKNFGV